MIKILEIFTSNVKFTDNFLNISDRDALYDQCFSENEEECPVNYSLKYSETESCKIIIKTNDDNDKNKFKNFSNYEDLCKEQPTNYSLKYGEKPVEEEEVDEEAIKNSNFNYYQSDKVKYKEYSDYAETDLDQPTDFTLKYGEPSDEEEKDDNFNYYENNDSKSSENFVEQSERVEVTNEQITEHYACEDETPLMFSRCSSLNSFSSFEQITQSIPDDRSSVVSDFSRTTSGVISPSELPDSPTQTAPSSPKRNKLVCFSINEDLGEKKSVFEDDVTTYKQEDTPIEFSRATSLSSLNIDNPVKTDFNLKVTSIHTNTIPFFHREREKKIIVKTYFLRLIHLLLLSLVGMK